MTATYPNEEMKISELQLADVVSIPGGNGTPWIHSIVKNVTDKEVTFFRPYGTHEGFSYTGGVICTIGVEEYSMPRDGKYTYFVHRRTELR